MPITESQYEELLLRYPFPRVIDNTMYDQWKACPHNFFRRTVQGLALAEYGEPGTTPKVKPSIHLHFGGCFAKGLEVTRREYYEGGAGFHEALAEGSTAIVKMWDKDGPFDFSPRTKTEEAKTLDNCLMAHAGYFREWDIEDPSQPVMVVNGKALVELSGARIIPGTQHPVTNEPILYAGRFDAVLDQFGAVGLDDKTTGSHVEGEGWQRRWSLRGQFTGYVWLAADWGYLMDRFLIHGVQVLKTKCNYAECMESRPWWMVERWLAQLQTDVHTMCSQWHDFIQMLAYQERSTHAQFGSGSDPFPQRFGDACHHFNTNCAFEPLCREPNPEDFLDRYIVSRWDPLHSPGEEE